MSRSTELIAAVKQQAADWSAWQADENRPNVDTPLVNSLLHLFAVFDDGDIPADCRVLELNVMSLAREFEAYDVREDAYATEFHEGFLAARERLVADLTVQERPAGKVLLSIQHFRDVEKCTDAQIAAIYDFTDRLGYTLPALVQQELDHPGSITATPGAVDGRDWVNPLASEWEGLEVHEDECDEPTTVELPPVKAGRKAGRKAKADKLLAA